MREREKKDKAGGKLSVKEGKKRKRKGKKN